MPEDTSNPFATVLGALASKGGAKGVVKDSEGKVSPMLSPNETARYEKIFGIMKRIVNPAPEVGQLDNANAKIGGTAAMQQAASDKDGMGVAGGLGALGLGAIAAAGLTRFWDEIVAGLQDFFGETLPNVGVATGKGLAVAAKALGKVGAKVFPILIGMVGKPLLKAMRFLPFIGTIASFALAYLDYEDKDYVGMGLNIVSGLINLIPVVGNIASILLDGFIMWRDLTSAKDDGNGDLEVSDEEALDNARAEIWGVLSSKLRYLPVVGGLYRWGKAYKDFNAGRWSSGMKNLSLGMMSFQIGDGAAEFIDKKIFGMGIAVYDWLTKSKEDDQSDELAIGKLAGLKSLTIHLTTKTADFFMRLGSKIQSMVTSFFDNIPVEGLVNNITTVAEEIQTEVNYAKEGAKMYANELLDAGAQGVSAAGIVDL